MQDNRKCTVQKSDTLLKGFLESWLEWATTGAHDSYPYFREDGLCASVKYYAKTDLHVQDIIRTALRRHLGGEVYPFGGINVHFAELVDERMHLNQDRLQWVKNTIEKLSQDIVVYSEVENKMELTVMATSYCLEVTLDEMLQIVENDESQLSRGGETLYDTLRSAGAYGVEYDGRFGSALLFFSLHEDNKDQLPNIILLVHSYINTSKR